ncbi:Lateral organ boundaries, LOB [Dillenia turbinata]|uniref:Lateral organ boundaries, LOB n=1 Tax=Dillenia turbinata TaxID=194707 RepID=A0AAN8UKG1_9MAGN
MSGENSSNHGGAGGGGGGPCGACKFLRRKCVRGCIFAPYFDPDQGTAHFAAVHKVFGASNASKLLLRIPPHKRLDAVVSLCYEALARVRDPVYGCVSHIFSLQQQVVNLQAELAYIQARLSTLQHLSPLPPSHRHQPQSPSLANRPPRPPDSASTSNTALIQFDPLLPQQASNELASSFWNIDDQLVLDQLGSVDDVELQALAREFISRYLPGLRFRPPSTSP